MVCIQGCGSHGARCDRPPSPPSFWRHCVSSPPPSFVATSDIFSQLVRSTKYIRLRALCNEWVIKMSWKYYIALRFNWSRSVTLKMCQIHFRTPPRELTTPNGWEGFKPSPIPYGVSFSVYARSDSTGTVYERTQTQSTQAWLTKSENNRT